MNINIANIFYYQFFQNALIGCLFAAILCGLVGTYVVTRRLVFVTGGLTHASFGGIGIGMLTGVSPLAVATLFSTLTACGIQWLSGRRDMREDSAIAVFWTLGMSIGIISSFLTPGFSSELSSYLFGNVLTITNTDLYFLGALTIVSMILFVFLGSHLAAFAFDIEFARSTGARVWIFEYGMMIFVALSIVACLRIVGIVLLISLFSVPQITANLFTKNFNKMGWLSAAIGYISCLGGLTLSILWDIPSGATIIFVATIIYLVCKGINMCILHSKIQ